MNYRHAYHAGNHGDVLKHIALTRILVALKSKEKPFCFADSHAGEGVYSLDGVEAGKTREWEAGFGRLAAPFSAAVESLLEPFRSAVSALNQNRAALRYPGSPWFAAHLLRPQDRLLLNELHPADGQTLLDNFSADNRVSVSMIDASRFLRLVLPARERRGLILIDPAYEARDDGERALKSLAGAHRKFATGCFLLWYPVKGRDFSERFLQEIKALELPETLQIEIRVKEAFDEGGLAGSGLIAVNPPWKLDEEMRMIAPVLAERLGLGAWGRATVEWLTPPR
jgi:23S rRNA (adenine2030-N6)-methyltransferase